MTRHGGRGPDLLVAGAARSATTALAAWVGRHPDVVSPSIKEPNFFSTRQHRGQRWYESLFDRTDGTWIDASAQYTFPSHLEALTLASRLNPAVRIVYVVRDPLPRMYSHYCHEVLYMGRGGGSDLGAALAANSDILGASDYDAVIPALVAAVPEEQVLVLPFELVIREPEHAARRVWSFSGLRPADADELRAIDPELFANERGVFASSLARQAFKSIRATRLYPHLRAGIGAERMRRVRRRLITADTIPSLDSALLTCSAEQRAGMAQIAERAAVAVQNHLVEQRGGDGAELAAWCSWLESPTLPGDV